MPSHRRQSPSRTRSPHAAGVSPTSVRRLGGDEEGAAYAEYVILVGVVGIVVATAVVALGPPLVASFAYAEAVLLLPIP